jgi:tRNA dimethylallyltransferase
VGKTALAVRLAEAISGEIVSADSRQVYRGMDIGTAKPSPEEQKRVRHHLLDIVDLDQSLGVAEFQRLALAAIDGILARGRIPLLVGGTGQYVLAVVEGWQVPPVPPDEALRRALYQQASQYGAEALHERLRAVDPQAAGRIDARNVRRVVRALEVCLLTGRPLSAQQTKAQPDYRILMLGLTLPRYELYRRIDDRVDAMMRAGLEDEVRRLHGSGYGFGLPAMSGVGYGQFEGYLSGRVPLAEVVTDIKRATRRFVRQQYNWFRLNDARIDWFQAEPDPYGQALALVSSFLLTGPDCRVRCQATDSGG